jgi:hypothetical protein
LGRELDFYISRLHWIELGSMSFDRLADRLATVLGGGSVYWLSRMAHRVTAHQQQTAATRRLGRSLFGELRLADHIYH